MNLQVVSLMWVTHVGGTGRVLQEHDAKKIYCLFIDEKSRLRMTFRHAVWHIALHYIAEVTAGRSKVNPLVNFLDKINNRVKHKPKM